jgi:Fe-coproporphyrin III synthase
MQLEDLRDPKRDDHACCFLDIGGVRVLWELTKRCTLACDHCLVPPVKGQDKKLELTTQECILVLNKLVGANPEVKQIIFSGGEALVRKDIPLLIEETIKRGISPALITNGTLVTAEVARELAEAGLRNAIVSLDGADAKTHDLQRGKGSFDKAVQAIRHFTSNGINVHVSTVPTKRNISGLPQLVKDCAALGGASITFSGWVEIAGMRGKSRDLRPSSEQMADFLAALRGIEKEVSLEIQTNRFVPHSPLEACRAAIRC